MPKCIAALKNVSSHNPPHLSPFKTRRAGAHPSYAAVSYPFYSKGDVGARIQASNESGTRIPLRLKARWCYQMAAAIKHTHLVAHSYHMDIKPGNFLIDDDENLILIDWEKSNASPTTLAPEADGTWDVQEERVPSTSTTSAAGPQLKYTKYEGPERRNIDQDIGGHSWNIWNVFPLWQAEHPKALELAEVFSLGRSMWMLLRQPDMDGWDEIEHPTDLVTDWTDADDVPESWRQMVDRCMSTDPNRRPGVALLAEFWEAAASEFSDEEK